MSARLIASTKTSFFILCICFYFCQAEIFNKDVIANPITGEGPEVAAKKTLAAAAQGVEEVPICMSLFFLVQCVSIAVAQRPPSLFPPSSLPLLSRSARGNSQVCMYAVCLLCMFVTTGPNTKLWTVWRGGATVSVDRNVPWCSDGNPICSKFCNNNRRKCRVLTEAAV